jgi:voltage-gated potassium channel
MKDTRRSLIRTAFLRHFVPSLFIGMIAVYLLMATLPEAWRAVMVTDWISGTGLIVGLANGLIVAAVMVLLEQSHNRRTRRSGFPPRAGKGRVYNISMGAVCGVMAAIFGVHNLGLVALTVMVLLNLLMNLRLFARSMTGMLAPGSHATWEEITELLRIYLTMLAGFTLLCASLEAAHLLSGTTPPFGFGTSGGELFLNALYFTVVTMTTLGYGDIVPHTPDGKLLLIFQCMASYVMFALMIGIITRGVIPTTRPADPKE